MHASDEPVTFVYHDADGDCQFIGDTGTENGVAVYFHHPIDMDPSLKELTDLPVGWCAERSAPGDLWQRSEWEIEEDSDEDK